VSVHGFVREAGPENDPGSSSKNFPILLFQRLSETSMVPPKIGYYFVRPGVRQVISHVIDIPSNVSAIRVIAGFLYHRHSKYPHTALRIFEVTPAAETTPTV
jgi:hypothetical protein